MFFIMGVTQGSKQIGFRQNIVCPVCGRHGSWIIYMTYTVLTLFFIPIFKWNRQYFVRTTCCDRTWQLDPELGKRIARGEDVPIRPEDLQDLSAWEPGKYDPATNSSGSGFAAEDARNPVPYPDGRTDHTGHVNPWTNQQAEAGSKDSDVVSEDFEAGSAELAAAKRICPNCGYEADPDFVFCPKCGSKL